MADTWKTVRELWDTFDNNPANQRTVDAIKGMFGLLPAGAGDVASGLLAADDVRRGDYTSAALNGVGVLPFIPSMAGMITTKAKGYAPAYLTEKVVQGFNNLPKSDRYDAAGNLFDDMYANIKPLQDGGYLGRYSPQWGSKSKPFYAIGDDINELADYMLLRKSKSDKAIDTAQKAKDGKSLLGMLKSQLGVDDSAFDFAKSTQSKSQYFTYKPTGTKIRVSDHSLPLHYEQPDVDLRDWMSDDEKLKMILDAIK